MFKQFFLLSLTVLLFLLPEDAFAQNVPPEITTTAPTEATEDLLYTYSASADDDDEPEQDLTWTLETAPLGMSVSPTTSTNGVTVSVSWIPPEGGSTSEEVTLRVTDEDDAFVEETFTITVAPDNSAPTITTTAPTKSASARKRTIDSANPSNSLSISPMACRSSTVMSIEVRRISSPV